MPPKSDSRSGSVTPTPRGHSETRDTQETSGSTSRSSSRDHVRDIAIEAEARLKKIKEKEERREDLAKTVKSISDLAKNDTIELSLVDRLEEMESNPDHYRDELKELKEKESGVYHRLQSIRHTDDIKQQRQKIKNDIDKVLDHIKQVVPTQGDPPANMRDVVKALTKLRDDDPYLFLNLLDSSKERYSINEAFEPTKRFIADINEKLSTYDSLIEALNKATEPERGPAGSNYAKENLMKIKKDEPDVYENLCDRLKERCRRDKAFERTQKIIDGIAEEEKARESAKKLIGILNTAYQEKIAPIDELNKRVIKKLVFLKQNPEIDVDTSKAVNQLLTAYREKDSAFKKNPPPFRDKDLSVRDKDLSDRIEMRLKLIYDVLQDEEFSDQQKHKLIDQGNSSIENAINDANKAFEAKMDTLIPEHLAFLTDLDSKITSLQEKASKERTQVEPVEEHRQVEPVEERTQVEPVEEHRQTEEALTQAIQKATQSFDRAIKAMRKTFDLRDPLAPPKVLPERGGELTALLRNMHQEIIANPGRLNDISYRNGIKSRFIGIKNNSEDEFRYLETEIGHQVGMHHDTWNPIKIIMDEVGGQTRS